MLMLTKWQAVQAKLTGTTRFPQNPDIVIGCVDNRKCREAILESLQASSHSAYWLDIGNSEHSGQAILGQVVSSRVKLPNRLPHAADLLPEIIDASLDDTDDTPSCSLAEALSKQSLFINETMANLACNMLWELIRFGRISHHGQFVNIKSGRVTPLVVDVEVWKRFGFGVPKIENKAEESCLAVSPSNGGCF